MYTTIVYNSAVIDFHMQLACLTNNSHVGSSAGSHIYPELQLEFPASLAALNAKCKASQVAVCRIGFSPSEMHG